MVTAELALVATLHKGWALSEIKALTTRERRYWIDTALWSLRKIGG